MDMGGAGEVCAREVKLWYTSVLDGFASLLLAQWSRACEYRNCRLLKGNSGWSSILLLEEWQDKIASLINGPLLQRSRVRSKVPNQLLLFPSFLCKLFFLLFKITDMRMLGERWKFDLETWSHLRAQSTIRHDMELLSSEHSTLKTWPRTCLNCS